MPDQILSQEEIDALLSAMAAGDVDLEAETKKKKTSEVAPYDLTSRQNILHNQFPVLDEIYDRFITFYRSVLAAIFRKPVDISLSSTEMIKFGELLKHFPSPTSYHIMNVEPLYGLGIIVVESKLAFAIIDSMLGGKGEELSWVREFTFIDQRVLKRYLNEFFKIMEKAWEIILPVKFTIKKTESKPQFVRIMAPNDLTVTSILNIRWEGFSGNIFISLPFLMLEPIKDKLTYRELLDAEFQEKGNENIRNLLKDIVVMISAELGRTSYSINDILNFHEGDILMLDNSPQDSITIRVEEIPKFKGLPGIVKGNRAVQITSLFKTNGGCDGN
jgi:flagellar motor switch protein FliM